MPSYKDDRNKKRITWYSTFYYKDWTGVHRRKKKCGFKTKREADEYERNFLSGPTTNTDILFPKLYQLYMDDIKGKIKASTVATKQNIIDNNILPYFKLKTVSDIKASDVRMWQNEIIKKGYSDTYMRSINSQFSSILNYAVKYYGLPSNPCHSAGTIGAKHANEMEIWTLEEFKQFISVVKEPRHHIAFNLLYWGGFRKGELMALTPKDILDGAIDVNKTGTWNKGNFVVTSPKTKKSKRIVTIPDFCYKELCDYVNRLYGIQETDRIFDFGSNGVLNTSLRRYAEKAGVKKIRVHDLRHSHASLCIDMGMSIVLISNRLGHENIETTLHTYSHLYPDKQKIVADQLNEKAADMFTLK